MQQPEPSKKHPKKTKKLNRRVLFWIWDLASKGFECYGPKITKKKEFTQTIFIPEGTQVVSGTKNGYIVVWDVSLILEDYSQPEERRQIKEVNLMASSKSESSDSSGIAINVLKVQGEYLVIGADDGSIRFYDFFYRIQGWFEDFEIGPITSISFAVSNMLSMSNIKKGKKDKQDDDEKKDEEIHLFSCPDFIVVDTNAKITLLNDSLYAKVGKEEKKGVVILHSISNSIEAIAVKPSSTYIAFACKGGRIFGWDHYKKDNTLESLGKFDICPTCLEYRYGAFAARIIV